MLAPKRVKFRKMFKGRTTGLAHRGATVAFGTNGLLGSFLASLILGFLAAGISFARYFPNEAEDRAKGTPHPGGYVNGMAAINWELRTTGAQGKAKTVSVEVRKKRTFVKRGPDEGENLRQEEEARRRADEEIKQGRYQGMKQVPILWDTRDDILFVSNHRAAGYFTNFGKTRRHLLEEAERALLANPQ
mgnify:CR=1 FL=1